MQFKNCGLTFDLEEEFLPSMRYLTLFDMGGGGHDGPPNIFDHCAQTLSRRKLKLGDF